MAKIKILTDRQGEKFYPVTTSQAVKDSEGNVLDDKLNTLEQKVDSAVTQEVLDTTLENYSTTDDVVQIVNNSQLKEFAEEWSTYGTSDLTGNSPIFFANNTRYTLEEAKLILQEGIITLPNIRCISNSEIKGTVRTDFSYTDMYVDFSGFIHQCPNLEILNLGGTGQNIYVDDATSFIRTAYRLKEIRGDLYFTDAKGLDTIFTETPNLESVNIKRLNKNINLSECPKLTYDTFNTINRFKAVLDDYIFIIVHPDVYAKFAGDTTNEAASKLSDTELQKWKTLARSLSNNKMIISTIEV